MSARNWTCTICGVGWATENDVPERCPVCSSRGLEEVVVAPVAHKLVKWGGLDFDTAALDLELREALAAVAPEGGALRALAAFASVRAALVALDDDLGREAEGAACELGVCLERLDAARVQLEAANAALMRARRTLGLS